MSDCQHPKDKIEEYNRVKQADGTWKDEDGFFCTLCGKAPLAHWEWCSCSGALRENEKLRGGVK